MDSQNLFGFIQPNLRERKKLQGTAFTSNPFKEYCEEENIQLFHIATGMPGGHGKIGAYSQNSCSND